jgi:hypothetical protein
MKNRHNDSSRIGKGAEEQQPFAVGCGSPNENLFMSGCRVSDS